ncbi:MAG: anion permease [Chloroflexi bacterium]|nr:anion permease [Chloroflexota bacterium]
MTIHAILVLFLLIVAAIFFITEWLRADLVALLLVVALGVSGVLTPEEALSGFSRSAVITILGIFILTAGLARTGATRALGVQLMRLGGHSELTMIVALMVVAAFLSLFMNNIAAASVLLPVAVGISRERQISLSRLMMPLAFGTLLGGMATLLTTSNILVSAALHDANYRAFELLDFAPIGVPLIIVGILYMVLIGRRLLPRRGPADWERLMLASRTRLADVYGLGERWVNARVPAVSALVGRTLAEVGLGSDLGVNVIAILNNGHSRLAPPPSERLKGGESVFLQARAEQVEELRARGLEILSEPARLESLSDGDIGLFEVVLSPRSRAVDKTLREIRFREKFGLNVIAIWRQGRPQRVGLGELALKPGYALLVLGPRARVGVLQDDGDFIVLTDTAEEGVRTQRMPHAIVIMAIAITLAASGLLATAEAVLAGALAMVVVGALSMDEAYQAVEWKSIFLIAGMLPVGLAMTNTGLAVMFGEAIVNQLGAHGPLVVVAGLLVVTTLFTQVMSGQAAAVILAPIAIHAAEAVHVDPRAFALAVAYGCSLAFITPLAHPANVLVMGPGGYKFKDYVRVGALLTLILMGVILALLVVLWGL